MRNILLSVLLASVGPMLAQGPKPKVVPFFAADPTSVGFVVTATNTTGADLKVISFMRRCQARIDGALVHVPDRGGSGGGRTIPPGGTWQELHRLFHGAPPTGGLRNPDPKNIAVNVPIETTLRPGKHTIAFNCDNDWSDDLSFEWK